MDTFFKVALGLHILSGSVGLLAGTIIMILRKGGAQHKNLGKVFFFAMGGIFITSVYMSVVTQNWFLLCVGFFSFYLAASGYRVLWFKKLSRFREGPALVDHILGIGGMLAGVGMWILTIMLWKEKQSFTVVPAVFGTIGFVLSLQFYKSFRTPPIQKNYWIKAHAIRMGGAYVSTVTAFLVVNVHVEPLWLFWLLPTVIVIPLVIYQSRRFMGGRAKNKILTAGKALI